MSTSKINIALVYGGRSAEHEVSILSTRSIYNNLDKSKYNIFPFAISKTGRWFKTEKSQQYLDSKIETIPDQKDRELFPLEVIDFLQKKIDLAFPVLHGPFGEDGKIQGFFDILNIPYVGCNLRTSAVSMDKELMKKLFAYHDIPQTKFEVLKKQQYQQEKNKKLYQKLKEKLGLPFFVKPANMGSSIGITKVNGKDIFAEAVNSAFSYDNKIIIENFVKAREIEASLISLNGEIRVSVPGEIIAQHDFYDYKAKYQDEKTRLIIPAEIEAKFREEINSLALRAFNAVGGDSMARIDFFLTEDEEVLVNEINTMPGFTNFSMYPLLFKESGFPYQKLLDKMIEQAMNRDI
ncbi:D-alanine--D-alanine ligase [Halanaerobium sp. Z-7514]|uniref:D-alanine--D-alanine ligase n=1 Tax=Halanaerobium polyolivorans TaxID=2886943 RepID=A0AAW4WYN9_9FIRM|nr:D-alanine--D-alanine ligase family protein [Halanaerobium polyolivorans]MCC3144737.1 D-alanine--D-alanine ligase [Halanaerobium polyolivorans]